MTTPNRPTVPGRPEAGSKFAGATYHDSFARCPECTHATVGLSLPYAINHAAGCSMPPIPPESDPVGEQAREAGSRPAEDPMELVAQAIRREFAKTRLYGLVSIQLGTTASEILGLAAVQALEASGLLSPDGGRAVVLDELSELNGEIAAAVGRLRCDHPDEPDLERLRQLVKEIRAKLSPSQERS